jgi:hypothetical protein
MGDSCDSAVDEVATNSWFESLLFPGAIGSLVGGPLAAIGRIAVGGLIAYQFEKNIRKKIEEEIH